LIMGCRYYNPWSGMTCDCEMGNNYQKLCAAKEYTHAHGTIPGVWQECKGHSGKSCDVTPSAQLIADRAAPAPPSPPPSPPSPPPAPPQKCIPQDQSDELLPKPTNPADPVNEPCYSHSSAYRYDPATGGPTTSLSAAIICVKVGTCDGMTLSSREFYYEGGCRPFFTGNKSDGSPYTYYVGESWNVRANTSTSTTWPTSTEGCVKQGECVIPYNEQIRHYTSRVPASRADKGLEMATPSDETMDRLLHNAIEAYPDACRDADLYPRTAVTATHHVMATVTVAAELSSFTTTVLEAMEAKVAREMGVAPANVEIKAAAGSVVLTINIGYDDADKAAAAKTTMATAMSDNSKAAAMLSTPTMAMTNAMVTAVGTPSSGQGSSAPPSPPPPPALVTGPAKKETDSDDGLSVGAIAGIAVGASLAVILVVGGVIFMMMNKKKTVASTKGTP